MYIVSKDETPESEEMVQEFFCFENVPVRQTRVGNFATVVCGIREFVAILKNAKIRKRKLSCTTCTKKTENTKKR